jgi:NTE family protein
MMISGNVPAARVAKLRVFWERVTAKPYWDWSERLLAAKSDAVRQWLNQMSAYFALGSGAFGFFTPRSPAPWLHPPGTTSATSFYDTSRLGQTLQDLVDFDRINAQRMRLSVGAVNVKSGNFVYFDSTTHKIGPEHVMASAALPPGFPAIEIEGEHYWDGGSVSNTPLQWIVDSSPHFDTQAFQIDLWNARGELPRTSQRWQPAKKKFSTRVARAPALTASNISSGCDEPLPTCSRSSQRRYATVPRRSCCARLAIARSTTSCT